MADTGHFNAFHEALTADLKAALAPVSVEEHFGPFDLSELKAYGATLPAVRVAISGPSATLARSSGDREASLVVAIFVITGTQPRVPAHKPGLDLCERIAAHVHRKTFGLVYVEPPVDVVIENHYSAELRRHGGGLALFSVAWNQVVHFGVATAPIPPRLPPTSSAPVPVPVIDFEVIP